MKKLFLVLFAVILNFAPLFAQDNNPPANPSNPQFEKAQATVLAGGHRRHRRRRRHHRHHHHHHHHRRAIRVVRAVVS